MSFYNDIVHYTLLHDKCECNADSNKFSRKASVK